VKEEDVSPLKEWLQKYRVPIVIFQVFLDELHTSPLEEIINKGTLCRDRTTKKPTYFLQISPQTRLADIKDIYFEKGKLIPFVMLKGGTFTNVNTETIRDLATTFRKP
jgi:hypothetical protein